MRALELQSLDGPGALELVERPEPDGKDLVIVEVRAAGVCFPDLLLTRGLYQDAVKPPAIIGSEIAGVVRSAPASSALTPGDRVWAMPSGGGFAEVIALRPEDVHPLPGNLSFNEGAALGINFPTAVFTLTDAAPITAGQTLVVLGAAGGLGTALLAVGRHLGARTIGVVSSADKADVARAAGAEHTVDSVPWKSEVLSLTDGRGADVVADVVGGSQTLEAVRACAPYGRVLILGFTSREIPEIPTNRLLLRNVSLVGVGLGAMMPHRPTLMADTIGRLEQMLREGLKPVVGRVFPLSDGEQALRELDERRAAGKVVLAVSA